jgi:transposase
VTQIRLFGGRCACCGERVTAQAPVGLEQGSPFGPSIAATVVYLHYAHAIGMERLALLMNELFSLSISEGAICNILARAREPLLDAPATIEKVVLTSPVVCSDETSVRAKGKNWWEWAEPAKGSTDAQHRWKAGGGVHRHAGGAACDQPSLACSLAQPGQGGGDRAVRRHPARGMGVAAKGSSGAADGKAAKGSDMLGSQRGHGARWQVCLAHLLRDAKYAIECGDTAFSAPFRWLLLRSAGGARR